MKRPLKKLFLLISLSAFALSIYSVLQHWQYQEALADIPKMLRLNVNASQINQHIEESIENSEFDDARMYLDIARSNKYQVDFIHYQNEIDRRDTKFKKITTQVSNFLSGFAEGESPNMAGLAGAVAADFTVVGDVRDLRSEYKKHSKGENVNELIVLLSGAGIGLTALTVGSLGSAAPAKAGASTIKVAVKMQRLTARFQKQLIKMGRNVFDWPAFTRLTKQDKSLSNLRKAAKQAYKATAIKPFKKLASQVNGIRKSTSAIDTVHLLKYVETTDDLRHLEKVSLKYGSKTKGLMKLVGKGAIRTVRVLRKTTALILSLVGSVLSGLLSLLFLFRYSLF